MLDVLEKELSDYAASLSLSSYCLESGFHGATIHEITRTGTKHFVVFRCVSWIVCPSADAHIRDPQLERLLFDATPLTTA